MDVSSHEDSAGEFCCVGSYFLMKLLGFTSKAIKLLLTELVDQYMNILPLAFKGKGNLGQESVKREHLSFWGEIGTITIDFPGK